MPTSCKTRRPAPQFGGASKLPLWTTKGWQTTRPVYAIDDTTLAEGLATEFPVWSPGGELTQFRSLLSHLHLTEVAAESTTVVAASAADRDEETTELLRIAIPLLQEDLARNDPTTEAALGVGWDRLRIFEVRVAPASAFGSPPSQARHESRSRRRPTQTLAFYTSKTRSLSPATTAGARDRRAIHRRPSPRCTRLACRVRVRASRP